MTNPTNDYSQYHKDTIDDYCQEKQIDFMRIGRAAVDKGQLMNEMYQSMLLELPDTKTWDETFEQYEKLFRDLERNITTTLINKGAEYIESITPEHPNYQKANKRYDELLKSLGEIA